MGETTAKKDKEKKKAKLKQDKAQKMMDRKTNNNKGKSLEDMLAYIDEDGNLSSTPPDPHKKKEINLEDIQLGAAKPRPYDPQEAIRTGVVTYFNESKGYGFINDLKSQQSVFVHVNQLSAPVKERDKVTFETESGPRGLSAIRVKKSA
jgi:cold shock CspA family protein